ncbi:aminoglycoside phosphotransferase family protein [Streptomyces sp. NPDC090306]|uniref:aminoglycoside phosphotransferase family protein n=1 Tax=Streptomyces sp. NPDC090306 TaxID=3365961 RepID=UPI00382E3989
MHDATHDATAARTDTPGGEPPPRPDAVLVQKLIATAFPQWAVLPVRPVGTAGTANAMFRLGTDMVVRLPLTGGSAADIEKERDWLPQLAPQLPVSVPVPLETAPPGPDFPHPWAVHRWLDGHTPTVGRIAEPGLLARDVARFVAALRGVDPTGAPRSYRGEPLTARDAQTRASIAELDTVVDTGAVTAAWESALSAPAPAGPPVWIHADLQPGNLLVDHAHDRLAAVIDFACTGVGDPAVDLIVAWYVLPAEVRRIFRLALGDDDATWARGRGWALSIALAELAHYRGRDATMTANAEHVVREVLADGAASR